jgi:hypothetical protein
MNDQKYVQIGLRTNNTFRGDNSWSVDISPMVHKISDVEDLLNDMISLCYDMFTEITPEDPTLILLDASEDQYMRSRNLLNEGMCMNNEFQSDIKDNDLLKTINKLRNIALKEGE